MNSSTEHSLETLLTHHCEDVAVIRALLKQGEHSRAMMKLSVLESSLHTLLAVFNTEKEPYACHEP